MNKTGLKIDLGADASGKLQTIAKELGISESEVIRKGIMLMGLYAQIKDDKANGEGYSRILLEENGSIRELVL